ncbi:MFS transporter [Vacuolonema iberomarrocanum]|uniref:MFS transporter n=1 Tax=Vacuolonema iberomarrocanum TaxID=3454632 RepID=UPI001A0E10E0|nr:MFS transporter [filamentous cyanobacterium LEGE 07170]
MRVFITIWFGQLVSTIGSYMTGFALILWAWELTGSATALALFGFFSQLPSIPITLVAGVVVDRCDRKQLMILGDSVAALSTIGIGGLYLTGNLQIWHLYLAATLNGGFGQIQRLAYQASISLMVDRTQLTRANSLLSSVHYSSTILGPALAGLLYPLIGLLGILCIDLVTFGVAIALLLLCAIPQPQAQTSAERDPLLSQLTFGFRYVWRQTNLRSLLLITASFWFFHDFGGAVYEPMLLARTDGSAQVLASAGAAAGIGGVTGAIVLSVWGGPKRRVIGLLAGFIGAGLSKTIFGLGRSPQVWLPAQVSSSLNFPLLGSSENALWMDTIPAAIQGRVFAANSLVVQGVSAVALLLAGSLADHLLEPAMMPGQPLANGFGAIFGSGFGAGMAVLYTLCALAMLLIGIGGFFIRSLRAIEANS